MLFWIITGGLALAVVALITVPLLRHTPEAAEDRTEVAIYRAQLAEIDRDIARGILSGDEAERTRTEVARRLLAADAAAEPELREAPRSLTLAAVGLSAALVAGGGIWLYSELGAADAEGPYPDIPRAARIAASEERAQDRLSQADAMVAADAIRAQDMPEPAAETLDLAVRLREAVDLTPEDPEGWSWLARVEATLGNFDDAIDAQERLVGLLPEGSDARREEVVRLLDMMVSAVQGYISPEAEQLATSLLVDDPENIAARYYMGLHFYQIDRPDRAFVLWREVVAEGEPSSPHVLLARQFVEDAAFRAGVDYELPPVPGAAQPLRGPTAESMEAAQDMDPEARAAMIQSMVSGLAERLATEGGSADDWAQLITALSVLGDTDRAQSIVDEAREIFPEASQDLAIVEAAAQRAGLQ